MRRRLSYLCLMAHVVSSFLLSTHYNHIWTPPTRQWPTLFHAAGDDNDADDNEASHPLSQTCRLSHAMFKVESVNNAVAYWTKKGGKVLQSRTAAAGDDTDKLQSAFVTLGNGRADDDDSSCFALELVQTDNCQIGNVLNYVGVSLLLQFQQGDKNGLQGFLSATSSTTTTTSSSSSKGDDGEPHGIPVKSCASSPGDYLCRICLKSNNLQATRAFYQNILGMHVAAADESQLCLRYKTDADTSFGVPTTLVFEGSNEKLNHGTCWDHLAIRTTVNVMELFDRLKQQKQQQDEQDATIIYMHPTPMFGMMVMGLRDPSGYKVVLAGPA